MPEYRPLPSIQKMFRSAIRGLATDRDGLLYAAGDSEIRVFTQKAWLKRKWPTAQPAHSVAVDDDTVWVGEEGQIEIFNLDGKLQRTWRDIGVQGFVTAIGFSRGDILAADTAGRCIRRYDHQAKLLNVIGTNTNVGGFLIPNGILSFAIDSQGLIHAANPGKHRVERYSPEGDLLGHIGRFDGTDPAGFTGCCNPTNIAVRGRIYTTEKAVPRVKAYDFAGNLLSVIAPPEAFDPNVKNMSIAVAPNGRVYVVDTARLSILAFEPEPA